jgi:hypothetical protein
MATPTAEELLDLCKDTIKKHGRRDTALKELEDYYFLELTKEEEQRAKDDAIELVRGPHGTNAVDLVQDVLLGADVTVTVPARSENVTDKKHADQAEKFLRSCRQQSERAQRQSLLGQGAWNVSMRATLAGRVICRDKMFKKKGATQEEKWEMGEKIPIAMQLRDPRFIYPEFGVDGLQFICEQWRRTVQDIRASIGPDLLPEKKLTEEVDWLEYWDDTHYCWWANGSPVPQPEEIGGGDGPWEHRYGGNPYAFEFARQTGKMQPEKRARPLLEGLKGTVDKMDMLESMSMTHVAQYIGSSLVVKSHSDDDVDVDLRPGAVNQILPDESIDFLYAGRAPFELNDSLGRFQVLFERGTFPGTMFGEDPGRVVAGYAISLLNQSGQMRLGPMVDCMERFLGSMYSNVLMIAENYLQALIDGPIPFYEYIDKDTGEGDSYRARSEQEFDAKKLAGHYHVDVGIGELLPGDEQANLNLAERARAPGADGRPLLSWETVLEKYELGKSAGEERDRIDRELAWNHPDVVFLREKILVARLIKEMEDELADLDIDPEEALAEAKAAQQPAPMPVAEMPPGGQGVAPEAMGPPPPPEAQMQQPQPQGIEIAPGVFTMLPMELLQQLPPELLEQVVQMLTAGATDEEVMAWLEEQAMMAQQQAQAQMAGPGGGMAPTGPPPGMVPPGAVG